LFPRPRLYFTPHLGITRDLLLLAGSWEERRCQRATDQAPPGARFDSFFLLLISFCSVMGF
jgi:hypothetical protein